jgi:hypothetical protein
MKHKWNVALIYFTCDLFNDAVCSKDYALFVNNGLDRTWNKAVVANFKTTATVFAAHVKNAGEDNTKNYWSNWEN